MYASGPQPEGCNPCVTERLLENTDIYKMIHNSSKVRVVK